METGVVRKRSRRGREPDQAGSLFFREQRQLRAWPVRGGERGGEKRGEALDEALDGAPVEERVARLEGADKVLGLGMKLQGEIELGRPAIEVERREVEPGQLQRRIFRLLEHEERLEQRRDPELTLGHDGLDDPLERRALMGERRADALFHAPHERRERRMAARVDPERDRVDEEADDARELGAQAIRDGRSDDEVGLPRHRAEHPRPPREQHHERRGFERARDGVDGGSVDRERNAKSEAVGPHRTRTIERKLDRGRGALQRGDEIGDVVRHRRRAVIPHPHRVVRQL